jgi:hypothetical protein
MTGVSCVHLNLTLLLYPKQIHGEIPLRDTVS